MFAGLQETQMQSTNVRRSLHSQANTFCVHDVGFETKHSENDQGGQHRGEEIDKRNQDSIEVAVVVPLVVAGEGDDPAKAETQRKEDLRGCLSPNLGVQHDLQLETGQGAVRFSCCWSADY